MHTPENALEENRHLRRTMRDLVALSTLPAVWTGLRPDGIARSLADVLLNTLSLDLIYVRLADPTGEGVIEVVRSKHRPDAAHDEVVRASLTRLLESDWAEPPATTPDPFGAGTLHVAVTRFGIAADHGVLITASRHADFPTERDRLLLGVGANQTAIVVQRQRAEQRLREAEENFRTLADNIPQLAWIADAGTEGQVYWFNKTWLDYTGMTMEEMRGSGWQIVHHPDHAERVIKKFQRHVKESLDWEDTFPLRRHDGQFRWFLSRMKVIRNEAGTVVRIFGTNTDITEQKEAAENLRKLTAELSEADRRKNEFLATLAHELRNPLAPIRNGLQIMRLSSGNGVAVEQARTMMERQLSQMVRLVDDLLDVSRISRGKLELRKQRVELAAVVNNAVETSRPVIESSGQELIVSMPPKPVFVDADVVRLAQVFANLLNNAAKFSERGGRVKLTVERQGSDAVVSVQDTGFGIPPDMLPKIFDLFTQVDRSLERSQGGLGIGLTLVKRLVEMHGGRVEARSEGHGKGSEFVVRLPVVTSVVQKVKPSEEDEPACPSGQCRILVADDNRDSADSLAMMLTIMGNEVRTANDGLQAVDVAASFRPDVILLDIGMPKLNGYEACRRIREQSGGEKAVLIALTGWGQDEDKRRSGEAGFDHHMVKPVDPAALEKLLAGLQAVKA